MDIEIATDGTIWAVVLEFDGSAAWSSLRSFDGEAWTTHAVTPFIRFVGDVEIAPDGVIWAALADGTFGHVDADGSTWQTIEPPSTPPAGEHEYGFVATESGVWARHRTGVWHYADGAWEPITYGDPDAGTMPDGVFWGIGRGPPARTRRSSDMTRRAGSTGPFGNTACWGAGSSSLTRWHRMAASGPPGPGAA